MNNAINPGQIAIQEFKNIVFKSDEFFEIITKALKIFDSCQTKEHYETYFKFHDLAIKRLHKINRLMDFRLGSEIIDFEMTIRKRFAAKELNNGDDIK